MLIPVPASAANENPGPPTTTTTAPDSTTTTMPEESTTTTIESGSTTTTSATTTTTAASGTTTTTASSNTTTTTPTDPSTTTEPEDPLEGEDPDEIEELPLPSIRFPVIGRASFRDTYGAPRDGGARLHNGTDIFAEKGTPVVAVANGVVERMGETEDAGLFVVVRHNDGWRSVYVHINNDSPGTDNGLFVHYGPGIRVGARVSAGTIVGYVGDSGNAEESAPHLHFELHQPDGFRPNPYPALRAAARSSRTTTLQTVDYRDLVAENTKLVGHFDPGTGFNADVTVSDGHAYVGTAGTADRCPGTGIRVIDVTTPEEPILVTSFADHNEFPGTATQSIWVGNVVTDQFEGRLGIVGLSDCDNPLTGESHLVGFATYDLGDPSEPALLAAHPTMGSGITAFDVLFFDDSLTMGAVVPTLRPNTNGPSEFVATFDVSDPSSPETISVWTAEIDGAQEPAGPVDRATIVWSDPTALEAHLTSGDIYVIDTTDRATSLGEPVERAPGPDQDSSQAGEGQEEPLNGYFTDHRIVKLGENVEIQVGLSSGVVLMDLTDVSTPVEASRFIPAPAFDPQHWWTAPDGSIEFPMVWDVEGEHGYLYLSDVHSGLWIVEVTALLGMPPGPGEID